MFELFGRNKKKNDKDMEISIASGIRTDQFVQQVTKQADIEFAKPKYNPETRKMYYDNGASHRQAKENAFSQEGVVRDPYTGAELVHTVQEAKMRFGNDWQEHLAEADHIDPLNQIVKRVEDNPWIATRDVKSIGNDQENFQVISRRMNQTGGKGGSTQREWSQDYERMKKISEQTGEPIEDIAERIRQVGDTAEKRNNMKLAQAGIKNATTTFHSAGKVGATNSASTAATISSIYNIASCINGENTVADAFRNVSQEASRAAISGYIKTGSLTVLNHTLTSSNSEFLVTLGKKNVPGKVDVVQFLNTVAVTPDITCNLITG